MVLSRGRAWRVAGECSVASPAVAWAALSRRHYRRDAGGTSGSRAWQGGSRECAEAARRRPRRREV